MTHLAPYPSFTLPQRHLSVAVTESVPAAGAVGHLVFVGEAPPAASSLSSTRAAALGFEGKAGSTLVLPTAEGPVFVLVGGGDRAAVDSAALRDAAAQFARAIESQTELALLVPETPVPDGLGPRP